jgi:Predicted RNA-binding protein containing KH domain, possibly ribosomal protein
MPARKILSSDERRELRRIGHALNVIVQVGDGGLSDGLLAEVRRALDDHELIKIRLPAGAKEDRRTLIDALCDATGAALVQAIGRVALIYLPAEEPDPRKSNVLRHRLG